MAKRTQAGGNEDSKDFLTPTEIQHWTEREIRNARKALELRVKELSEIESAYTAGGITPDKADELHSRYHHRWGEALPGAIAWEGRPDEQILADIDKAAGPFTTPREDAEHTRRLRGGDAGGKSRLR
ncbi:MAG: hypothetical protein JO323_08500 [Acidobacteriia bacterium]|nr:hypothetical protein [Terriglobia bacterium]